MQQGLRDLTPIYKKLILPDPRYPCHQRAMVEGYSITQGLTPQ